MKKKYFVFGFFEAWDIDKNVSLPENFFGVIIFATEPIKARYEAEAWLVREMTIQHGRDAFLMECEAFENELSDPVSDEKLREIKRGVGIHKDFLPCWMKIKKNVSEENLDRLSQLDYITISLLARDELQERRRSRYEKAEPMGVCECRVPDIRSVH